MKYEGILNDLGELYHEYSFFGVENHQVNNNYKGNQVTKAPMLNAMIALAIALVKEKKKDLSFAELFCADAYFAMVAHRLGANRVVGIDNNRDGMSDETAKIAKRLNVPLEFHNINVEEASSLGQFDIVANIGGLYHVDDPESILDASYEMASQYLIVQNVVNLGNTSKKYFEKPAPGWTWGNRYSRESFSRLIKKKNYNIILEHFNTLGGNDRPEDKGCMFYLIQKT